MGTWPQLAHLAEEKEFYFMDGQDVLFFVVFCFFLRVLIERKLDMDKADT